VIRIRLLLLIAMLALGCLLLLRAAHKSGNCEPCPGRPPGPRATNPENIEDEYRRIAEELRRDKPISEIDIDIRPHGPVPPEYPPWE
jgi:hypothetical protein